MKGTLAMFVALVICVLTVVATAQETPNPYFAEKRNTFIDTVVEDDEYDQIIKTIQELSDSEVTSNYFEADPSSHTYTFLGTHITCLPEARQQEIGCWLEGKGHLPLSSDVYSDELDLVVRLLDLLQVDVKNPSFDSTSTSDSIGRRVLRSLSCVQGSRPVAFQSGPEFCDAESDPYFTSLGGQVDPNRISPRD